MKWPASVCLLCFCVKAYEQIYCCILDPLLSSTHQRFQLFVVRQVKLSHKVIEMFVAGVDVSLGSHLAHTVKVVDVDVDKHSEQTRQNLLSHLHKGLREGSTWESDRRRQKTVNHSDFSRLLYI